jgi:hypothetical protein
VAAIRRLAIAGGHRARGGADRGLSSARKSEDALESVRY